MRTRFASIAGTRFTTLASLVVVIAAFVGWTVTGHADAASSQSLGGAWNVTIDFDTPGFEGCTAPSLNTADGGVIAAACSLAESPGYGRWVRTGNRTFEITFVGQEFDLGTAAMNGTYKVRARVRLHEDLQQFSGPFVADIFALDGSLVISVSGLVTADRVTVESLP
jgi:hypothetical protein